MLTTLVSEKLPFLFTALIALATYQLNTVISLEVDSPTLVYQFKITREILHGKIVEKDLECEIVNTSLKSAFRNLKIHIQFRHDPLDPLPTPHLVFDPSLVPISPSPIVVDTLMNCIDDLVNEYNIEVIQPRGGYVLKLKTSQNIGIDEFPKLYLDSETDVRLVERSIETFLVENQVFLNILILIFSLFAIILYLIFIIQKGNTK